MRRRLTGDFPGIPLIPPGFPLIAPDFPVGAAPVVQYGPPR